MHAPRLRSMLLASLWWLWAGLPVSGEPKSEKRSGTEGATPAGGKAAPTPDAGPRRSAEVSGSRRDGDGTEAERRRADRRQRRRNRLPESGPETIHEPSRATRNVVVEVSPKNAEIYVGGVRYGRGKASFALPSGAWQIDLRAPGHGTLSIPLEVRSGTHYRLKRILAPIDGQVLGGGQASRSPS